MTHNVEKMTKIKNFTYKTYENVVVFSVMFYVLMTTNFNKLQERAYKYENEIS